MDSSSATVHVYYALSLVFVENNGAIHGNNRKIFGNNRRIWGEILNRVVGRKNGTALLLTRLREATERRTKMTFN